MRERIKVPTGDNTTAGRYFYWTELRQIETEVRKLEAYCSELETEIKRQTELLELLEDDGR